ncbi:probable cytochrome P450 6d5 [Bradysia coprophila]|uniref:probable cytochrome P450 6d5 n=1 Tax=Bradysia coprophila TaxID=38358 RepID=UPI00187DBC0D|nr:probable cytochrome P450 6d5 [Bradysia coprophila]
MANIVLNIILGSICVAITYIVLKIYWKLQYWNRRDFHQIDPHFIYGNLKPYIRRNIDFGAMLRNYYNESNGRRCVGLYMFYKPALLLRDPNLIRTFLFNDFDSFSTRKIFAEKEKCPLLDNLYQHSGDQWKKKRDLLAKAFTLKNISELYDTIIVVSALEDYLDALAEKAENSICINRLMERQLYNVMAWVIFGVHIETIAYSEDNFRMTGLEVFRPKFVDKLALIRDVAVPAEWEWLHNWLNFRRHSKRIEDFYNSLTKHVLDRREYHKKEWNANKDYMQYLMKIRNRGFLYDDEELKNIEANAGAHKYLSLPEVSSLAFLAFTSGFPTILSTIDFFLLEIAKNHTIQNRISVEVEAMFESTDGNPEYKDIAHMKYLDACVNETFRKYPPISHLVRYCTKDYLMKKENFLIHKGMPVFISILGIHHDPTYYPDPMEFDPERFTAEESRKRPAITFIPFGFGPKNCLGIELAKAILKIHLVFLVSKYKVSVAPRMRNRNINFDNGHMNEVNQIHLSFAERMRNSPSEEDD